MGIFVNPDNAAFQSALNAKSILDEEKLIWNAFCCLYETFHMALLGGSEGVEYYRSIKLSKKSTNSKDKFYIINAT